MSDVSTLADNKYTAGFSTNTESESFEPGLSEDIVKRLSAIKNEPEWVTEFRLKAFEQATTNKRLHQEIFVLPVPQRDQRIRAC